MKKGILFTAICLLSLSLFAQVNDKVVLTIGDESVYLSEFDFIFRKNNSEGTVTKKAIDEYLELFTVFRLKVKEAKELKMDTSRAFINELNGYVKQLAVPYLKDREAESKMINETYERMGKDLKIRHILITTKDCDLPADTLAAFNKINVIRKEIVAKKKSFEQAAMAYSQDTNSAKNGGLIGYFSALSLVYAFENEAYRLKVGELSRIVRTNYGYHLIQIDDIRPARGKVKIAHIFLRADESNQAQTDLVLKRANEAYARLQEGELFENVVKTYSEDYNTASKGGELPAFGINQMVTEFEEAAFSLQKPGDYSKPFQTKYGFHIIKLIEKSTRPSFDDYKTELTKTLQKQKRWEETRQSLIAKLKKEYNFIEDKTFLKLIEQEANRNNQKLTRDFIMSLPDVKLFEMKGVSYTSKDFIENMSGKIASDRPIEFCLLKKNYYYPYIDTKIMDYKEENLPNEFVDFKMLVNEYRDGILLFNLMDLMVWGKSMKDTVGLKAFHDLNKQQYMWPERARVITVDCKDDKVEAEARKLAPQLLSGKLSKDAFAAKLNKKVKDNVILLDGLYSREDKYALIDGTFEKRIGETVRKDNKIRFAVITEILSPQPKSLKETKGVVISDYQAYLEQDWVRELRKKYPVSVNYDVLYSLISK